VVLTSTPSVVTLPALSRAPDDVRPSPTNYPCSWTRYKMPTQQLKQTRLDYYCWFAATTTLWGIRTHRNYSIVTWRWTTRF